MCVVSSLCEVGVVKLYVNRWVPISFILLPKAHLSILPGIGSPTIVKVYFIVPLPANSAGICMFRGSSNTSSAESVMKDYVYIHITDPLFC